MALWVLDRRQWNNIELLNWTHYIFKAPSSPPLYSSFWDSCAHGGVLLLPAGFCTLAESLFGLTHWPCARMCVCLRMAGWTINLSGYPLLWSVIPMPCLIFLQTVCLCLSLHFTVCMRVCVDMAQGLKRGIQKVKDTECQSLNTIRMSVCLGKNRAFYLPWTAGTCCCFRWRGRVETMPLCLTSTSTT